MEKTNEFSAFYINNKEKQRRKKRKYTEQSEFDVTVSIYFLF